MDGYEQSLRRQWESRQRDPPQRFRELVRAIDAVARQPGAMEAFRGHIRDVAKRRADVILAKGTIEEKLRPFHDAHESPPQELLDELRAAEGKLSIPRGPGEPLTLAEKYAYLGAVHDEFAEAERFDRIDPPEWGGDSVADFLADWPARKADFCAALSYHALASGFEDKHVVPDDSPEVDVLWRYLDEVKADLASAGGRDKAADAVQAYLDRVLTHAATVDNELQRSKAPTYPVNDQTVWANCKALLWLLGPAVPTGDFDQDAMAGYGVEPITLMSFFATCGQDSDILRALGWLADLSGKLEGEGAASRPDTALVDGWHDATALLREAVKEACEHDSRLHVTSRPTGGNIADVGNSSVGDRQGGPGIPHGPRAGEAFAEAMRDDLETEAAWRRAQERLRAFPEAVGTGGFAKSDPEYQRLQGELAEAMTGALRASGDELAAEGFKPPETIEDWEQLALIVEIPVETIRAGNLALREIHAVALAWADRQKMKRDIFLGKARRGKRSPKLRAWTQADLDKAIREYKAKRSRQYTDMLAAIQQDRPGAKKAAREVFGRNAVAKALGVKSAGMVSKSPAWTGIARELGFALHRDRLKGTHRTAKTGKVGLEMAVEKKSQDAPEGADHAPAEASLESAERQETIRRINRLARFGKTAKEKAENREAAEELIRKLKCEQCTDDQARCVVAMVVDRAE